MEDHSIQTFINSSDPLSIEAMEYLLQYSEEDEFVDFKQTYNSKDPKHILSATEDIVAFANTKGGYLVFGVEDATYSLIGLEEKDKSQLLDINKIIQKVNSYIEPELTSVRSKNIEKNGKSFVVIFVPESKGKTHIVKNDGKFKSSNGDLITKFHRGQIYVRRSASIAVVTSQELNMLIERRIDQYKEKLLERVARVVEAPFEQHVIIAEEVAGEDTMKIVISDAPDAMEIKGLSFTVAPENDPQEITAALALKKRDKDSSLSEMELWRLYANRESIPLQSEQIASFALMSLLMDVPCFYWLSKLSKQVISEVLIETLRSKVSIQIKSNVLNIACLLGKTTYAKVKSASGAAKEQLGDPYKQNKGKPELAFNHLIINHDLQCWKNPKVEAKKQLTKLATDSSARDKADVIVRHRCWALDSYLYPLNL